MLNVGKFVKLVFRIKIVLNLELFYFFNKEWKIEKCLIFYVDDDKFVFGVFRDVFKVILESGS